jgi:hypothetical protein
MGRKPLLLRLSPDFPRWPQPASACGISPPFGGLFPTAGQVAYVLLTRLPLTDQSQPVRLACVRRAASVRPEPGSNSPFVTLASEDALVRVDPRIGVLRSRLFHSSVGKVRRPAWADSFSIPHPEWACQPTPVGYAGTVYLAGRYRRTCISASLRTDDLNRSSPRWPRQVLPDYGV